VNAPLSLVHTMRL